MTLSPTKKLNVQCEMLESSDYSSEQIRDSRSFYNQEHNNILSQTLMPDSRARHMQQQPLVVCLQIH